MPGRNALQNSAFTLGGQLGARLLALALYAFLARVLGPARFGDIGLGTAFGALFCILIEPGLNPLLTRDGARDPALLRARVPLLLGYKLLAIAVCWPSMVGAAWLLGYRSTAIVGVVFSGGTLLWVMLEDLGSAALIAFGRNDLEAALRIVSRTLFAGSGLCALALGLGFTPVLAVLLGAQLAVTCVVLAMLRQARIPIRARLHAAELSRLLRQAWPLAVAGVLGLITLRLDQILASQLGVSEAGIGAYNAAVKIVEGLILFPFALSATFAPAVAQAWSQAKQRWAAATAISLDAALAVTLPIAVGGTLLAGDLTHLVYGGRFGESGPLLACQLALLPLLGLCFCGANALISAGALRLQLLATGSNLLVNVVCNLVLVPRLGILGASVSAVAGAAVAALVTLGALVGLGLRLPLGRGALASGLAALAMGASVHAARTHLGLFPCLGLGAAVYAAAFFAFGGRRMVKALREERPAVPQPG